MYLHVRHSGTFFLRSSYHYFFKNIAHVRSICNFDQSCILGGFSPQKLLDVSRHPVPFSWAGKLFVFTARKPLHPQHFVFTTRTLLLPCLSLGFQPHPQRIIFSKDSIYGGQISGVYCGFSLYIDCKLSLSSEAGASESKAYTRYTQYELYT